MLGLEPKFVDYSHLAVKLDEATLRAGLAADEKRLRELGYDARWLLIDRGETAEAVVAAAPKEKTFDCILIGAGIRTISDMSSRESARAECITTDVVESSSCPRPFVVLLRAETLLHEIDECAHVRGQPALAREHNVHVDRRDRPVGEERHELARS
jgi:hypothetical protein